MCAFYGIKLSFPARDDEHCNGISDQVRERARFGHEAVHAEN